MSGAFVISSMFLLILCVTAVLLAFIGRWVYRDAKEKGLPAAQWTLIALLVPGFLGLIIYMVYRSDKKAAIICPSCGNQVEYNASFCQFCGYQCPPEKKVLIYTGIPKKVIFVVVGCVAFLFFGVIGIGLFSASAYRNNMYSNSYEVAFDYPVQTAVPIPYDVAVPDTSYAIEIYQDNEGSGYFAPIVPEEYVYSESYSNDNGLSYSKSESFCSLSFSNGTTSDFYTTMYVTSSNVLLSYDASLGRGGSFRAVIVDNATDVELCQIYDISGTSSISGNISMKDFAGQNITIKMTAFDAWDGCVNLSMSYY